MRSSSDPAVTADLQPTVDVRTTSAWRQLSGTLLLLGAFLTVVALFAIILHDRSFLTIANFLNIGRQTTTITVMAVASVFVLSAGELDLSFGPTIALTALVGALMLRDVGPLPAISAALATGAAVGLVNGLVSIKLGIPSFIVTLGMLGVTTWMSRWITNLEAVPVTHEAFNFAFGSGEIGPIPVLLLWTAAAVAVGHVVLRRTAYGRKVLATGGNPTAALYSGIRTARIKIGVLVLSGATAALVGLLYAGRLHGARYSLGDTDLFLVLSAVIIGGTALTGGKGSVVGALIGSLLMGTINNGLVLMGLSVAQQEMARGLIIVLAVALGSRRRPIGHPMMKRQK